MGKSFYMNEEMWSAKAHKLFNTGVGPVGFLKQMRPHMHLIDDYILAEDEDVETVTMVTDMYENHVLATYNILTLKQKIKQLKE